MRDARSLVVLAWLLVMSSGACMSTLYLGVALRLSELKASGMLIGLTYCLYQVMSIVGGVAVPRYLSRRYACTLMLSSAAITALMIVIALFRSTLLITASFATLGLLLSAIPPAVTYILTTHQVGMRSSLLALTLPQNLGICLGFLSCGVVGTVLPLRQVLLYMSVFGLIMAAGSVMISIYRSTPGPSDREARHVDSRRGTVGDWRRGETLAQDVALRAMMLFYSAVFTSFLAAGIFFPVLPLILKRLGLTVSEIYLARFCGALTATLAYLYIINLVCSSPNKVFKVIEQGLAARCVLFMLLTPLITIRLSREVLLVSVYVLMSLIGVTWSIIHTGLRAVALEFGVYAHRVVGYTNSISSLGLVVGSLASGALLDVNMLLIPVTSSVVAAVAAMLYAACARACERGQSWVLSSAISSVPLSSPR